MVVAVEHLLHPGVDPAREGKSQGPDGRPKVEEGARGAQDGHSRRNPTKGSDQVRCCQDHLESRTLLVVFSRLFCMGVLAILRYF